jgi:hypothetical protein
MEESRLAAIRWNDLANLDRDILEMKTQLKTLRGLSGDRRLEGWMEMSVTSSRAMTLYPEYRAERVQMERALQEGFGPKHPKVLGLQVSVATKYDQLEAAAGAFEDKLSLRIEAAQKLREGARR